MPVNLDMDCLRTFAAIIELGSYAAASERIGRTQSAVSLQIRRLEEQLGVRLFQRRGRRMVASPEGERLLPAAQEILQRNDLIVGELAFPLLSGEISLGSIQDFADTMLPEILARFSHTHPTVRIFVKIDRTKVLAEAVDRGEIDLAIGVNKATRENDAVRYEKMVWIGADSKQLSADARVPLVLFEPPCSFRDAALDGLKKTGRQWDIVYTSPSLSGLKAAVQAGLGVTVRTALFVSSGLRTMPASSRLPELPRVGFGLYESENPSEAATQLKHHITTVIARTQRGEVP